MVPALVGVQSGEPYGTRTGLGITFGLGLAAAGIVAAKGDWRRRIAVPTVVGVTTFLVLAPVFIKTRFLLTSFLVWIVAGVAGMGWVAATRPKSEYRFLIILMTAAVLIDIANSSQLLAQIL